MIRTRPSWLKARTAFSGHHSWLFPSIHFRQLKAACNCSSMGSDSLTSPCVTKHFLGRHSMHVFSLWQGFQDRPKGGYHQNPTWWTDESYWGYIQEYGWELLYMPAILIFFKAFSFFFEIIYYFLFWVSSSLGHRKAASSLLKNNYLFLMVLWVCVGISMYTHWICIVFTNWAWGYNFQCYLNTGS